MEISYIRRAFWHTVLIPLYILVCIGTLINVIMIRSKRNAEKLDTILITKENAHK